ncbi:hypothetical protein QQF64_035774, partial [Cirrhinus molitorella]
WHLLKRSVKTLRLKKCFKSNMRILRNKQMAFNKEESEDMKIEEKFRVKHEDTEEQTDLMPLKEESQDSLYSESVHPKHEFSRWQVMAFIKEESEEMRIEETFRIKHEDIEEQTDLMLLKKESEELNEMEDKDQRRDNRWAKQLEHLRNPKFDISLPTTTTNPVPPMSIPGFPMANVPLASTTSQTVNRATVDFRFSKMEESLKDAVNTGERSLNVSGGETTDGQNNWNTSGTQNLTSPLHYNEQPSASNAWFSSGQRSHCLNHFTNCQQSNRWKILCHHSSWARLYCHVLHLSLLQRETHLRTV